MRIGSTASIAIVLFATGSALADVQISASLNPDRIAMSDQSVLSVTISGASTKLPNPELPGLTDFQISDAGSSQSFSWINGQVSASVTHTYVLTPKQPGRFTIPPIRVQADGKTFETGALNLEVLKGNASALPAAPTGGAQQQGATALFIEGTVDKQNAYVGEAVTYTFRLFNRAALIRQPQFQPPSTSGFWSEDLPPQRTFNTQVKGVPYQVVEVRTALFPTQPGKATIGSAALNVAIQNLSGDLFASFFGGGQEKTLRTEPIAIQVKPLPSPAPAGFEGAVGSYRLNTELDKTSTEMGQPLTLTVTISGRGNIKSLPNLKLPALTSFRTYESNAATNVDKKDYHVQGSKVFKTVLVPTGSGDLTIPPISFAFFDPAVGSYKTLTSQPLRVHVKPAPGGVTGAPGPLPGTPPRPGIKVVSEDIRYIRTPGQITSQPGPIYRNKIFLALNGFAFLGLILAGLQRLRMWIFLSDPVQVRFRRAREMANRHLKAAEIALGKSDLSSASRSLSQALQSYLGAKLNLNEFGLSLRAALEGLTARGVPRARIDQVQAIWEALDLYQFAPTQTRPEDIQASVAAVRELMIALEKELKWKD